jgi:hypothetical protein
MSAEISRQKMEVKMEDLEKLCIEILEQKVNEISNVKFTMCNKNHNGKKSIGNIVEMEFPNGTKHYKEFKNKSEIKKYYIEMLENKMYIVGEMFSAIIGG